MPLLIGRNPSYRLHRASGQAVVTLSGKDIYLGPHGSKTSRAEYDRVVAEWLHRGRSIANHADDPALSIVLLAYLNHAQIEWAGSKGSGELRSIKLALKVLRVLYGKKPVSEFGPLALQSVQSAMIDRGWSRGYINSQVKRIRRMMKWAASQELIPASIFEALKTVDPLRAGKTKARECEPVKPVAIAHVESTLRHCSRTVASMIRLQLATGMRPGEVCAMRGCDIDTTGKLWVYRPSTHKTAHHGHNREVFLGTKAQEIVAPFLKLDSNAHLFSPADAERERRERRSAERKTPLSCGNVPGSNRKRSPQRKPGECFRTSSYRGAIRRACEAAFPFPGAMSKEELAKLPAHRAATVKAEWKKWRKDHLWHPHQLRHAAATEIRRQFGIEAAQAVLGHSTLNATLIYAQQFASAARRVMAKIG